MSTVTLRILQYPNFVEVEMPSATTGRYAAKRAAEACGYDADGSEWGALDARWPNSYTDG